jgi:hypothetical protein
MNANRLLLGAALVAALSIIAGNAHAQGKSSFDRKGWTLLGEKQVDGKKDHDVVRVKGNDGPWSKVMLVVEDSDLELQDLEIQFGNGQKHNPSVKHVFKEGDRTRAIDLPGEKRHITKIALRYANLPGGGKARVLVFGKSEGAVEAVPGGPGPGAEPGDNRKARWDHNGWVMLGDKVVNGGADRDVIPVGKSEGKFTKLMMVVEDSDLELTDMEVIFGNGEKVNPKVKHVFQENDRTRAIDLPGDARTIKRIDLRYGNLPGGGKARVEVWGKEAGAPRNSGGPPDMGHGGGHAGWRGPMPLVGDFWPRRGALGTRLNIQGRRFAPGVQVVFGDKVVDASVVDPFRLTVTVPAGLKGAVPVMLRLDNGRDVPVGFFTVGGKDQDRVRIRARWRAESEKWWKMRERELAKVAADREAALARAEADLAAARDRRREARLVKLRKLWQAELLAREEARIELAVHAERGARLSRMLRLAEYGGMGPLAIRIHTLVEIENARHEARMTDLKLTASR